MNQETSGREYKATLVEIKRIMRDMIETPDRVASELRLTKSCAVMWDDGHAWVAAGFEKTPIEVVRSNVGYLLKKGNQAAVLKSFPAIEVFIP